ncbi:MAG: chromate efflux transporter [Thermoleophilia bacterium]|nr:chromate efflux transporter [Thermoleophilia bacterium]
MTVPAPSLGQLAGVFLRLGLTAFGGPAAHVALFRDELVRRRRWLSDQAYLDLLGAADLLPGPTSTEVALGVGRELGGLRGMALTGILFILPASLLVLLFAIAYDRLGSQPAMRWLLYGLQPVVVVIVIRALLVLAPTGLPTRTARILAIGALLAGLLDVHPLLVLGAAAMAMLLARGLLGEGSAGLVVLARLPGGAIVGVTGAAGSIGLGALFLTFLGIGAFTFGSGYLLLAFLQEAFVDTGLLTTQVLLDAVAVGQITPGPLFTTATFIGHQLAGMPGAILATVGIFLPSFLLVAAVHPLLPRLRASVRLAVLLDGVNAAALGLIGAVAAELAGAALVDAWSVIIAAAAAALLAVRRAGPTLALFGGGVAGLAIGALGLSPGQ